MGIARVITFDGGGVRGVIPVVVLQRLESEPGLEDLLERADFFAGTSTGGLIALGLAAGLSLSELRSMYEERAPRIFAETFLDDVRDLGKLIGADYRLEHLERQVHEVFGERRLGDLNRRVLVAAFDLDSQHSDPAAREWKPKIFHNFEGPDSDGQQLAYKVGTYTSAAPTYFPTADGFIDGGVFATNPSMCALAQTQDRRNRIQDRADLRDLVMLSLGTGRSLQYIEGGYHDWGYVQWVRPLIDLMLDGVNGIADYQCRQILQDHYCRFAPTFPAGRSIAQDDVDALPYLVDFAERLDLSELTTWVAENWSNAH
jgi:patatin-like phospholipase/acyl hydrolase